MAYSYQKAAQMESVINDYISHEIGQARALLSENFDHVNTICAYLRAREPGRRGAAHG